MQCDFKSKITLRIVDLNASSLELFKCRPRSAHILNAEGLFWYLPRSFPLLCVCGYWIVGLMVKSSYKFRRRVTKLLFDIVQWELSPQTGRGKSTITDLLWIDYFFSTRLWDFETAMRCRFRICDDVDSSGIFLSNAFLDYKHDARGFYLNASDALPFLFEIARIGYSYGRNIKFIMKKAVPFVKCEGWRAVCVVNSYSIGIEDLGECLRTNLCFLYGYTYFVSCSLRIIIFLFIYVMCKII